MFESETDTEVIPKLCNFLYKRLPESIPFPQVGGWAACVFVFVHAGRDGTAFVRCRRLMTSASLAQAYSYPQIKQN